MKPLSKSNITLCLIFSLILLVSYGCATPINNTVVAGSSHNLPPGMKQIDNSFWWKCQFRMAWPNNEPNWAVDLLLAHAVVSPVLSQHADNIPYWRFHRRAARDDVGHQFTFLFYSSPQIASSVFAAINKSEVLENTVKANLLDNVYMNDPKQPKRPHIGDTSDPTWSSELQKHWPTFIMGVSSLWLGLISEDMQHSSQNVDDINLLLDEYQQVETSLASKWRKEGQHALLHHLSAVFGYQPMLIKKEIRF